jgi:hypothetical protein
MKSLINATSKLNIPIEDEENKKIAEKIKKISNIEEYTQEIGEELKKLWEDKSIQACLDQRSRFQLYDSTEYFFQNLDRINDFKYQPNESDILRCRVKTTGIVEVDYSIQKQPFK